MNQIKEASNLDIHKLRLYRLSFPAIPAATDFWCRYVDREYIHRPVNTLLFLWGGFAD